MLGVLLPEVQNKTTRVRLQQIGLTCCPHHAGGGGRGVTNLGVVEATPCPSPPTHPMKGASQAWSAHGTTLHIVHYVHHCLLLLAAYVAQNCSTVHERGLLSPRCMRHTWLARLWALQLRALLLPPRRRPQWCDVAYGGNGNGNGRSSAHRAEAERGSLPRRMPLPTWVGTCLTWPPAPPPCPGSYLPRVPRHWQFPPPTSQYPQYPRTVLAPAS